MRGHLELLCGRIFPVLTDTPSGPRWLHHIEAVSLSEEMPTVLPKLANTVIISLSFLKYNLLSD